MRHHRQDVIDRALQVLDEYGLADLSMRRLAAELGVQPSALYHHVANKQELLAALADEVLGRTRSVPAVEGQPWQQLVVARCEALRDAMLAYRDGAELIATVHAFGLGAQGLADGLVEALGEGGLEPEMAQVGARTIVHFVFGHVSEEQMHLQASAAGAIATDLEQAPASAQTFALGLDLIVAGVEQRLATR